MRWSQAHRLHDVHQPDGDRDRRLSDHDARRPDHHLLADPDGGRRRARGGLFDLRCVRSTGADCVVLQLSARLSHLLMRRLLGQALVLQHVSEPDANLLPEPGCAVGDSVANRAASSWCALAQSGGSPANAPRTCNSNAGPVYAAARRLRPPVWLRVFVGPMWLVRTSLPEHRPA